MIYLYLLWFINQLITGGHHLVSAIVSSAGGRSDTKKPFDETRANSPDPWPLGERTQVAAESHGLC